MLLGTISTNHVLLFSLMYTYLRSSYKKKKKGIVWMRREVSGASVSQDGRASLTSDTRRSRGRLKGCQFVLEPIIRVCLY